VIDKLFHNFHRFLYLPVLDVELLLQLSDPLQVIEPGSEPGPQIGDLFSESVELSLEAKLERFVNVDQFGVVV